VASDEPPRRPGEPLGLRTRRRVYFIMMGTCLVLIVLAWMVVWRFSVLAAIISNSGSATRR
jgi:hypothetical protein